MASSVGRYLAAGVLAVAGVLASGVWLGHRLDPTWARRNAPLRRPLPFPLPALPGVAAAPGLRGQPWILELRFPGCGADESDVAARAQQLRREVRAARGASLGWFTLEVGGVPGSANTASAADGTWRQVAGLEPAALAGVAAELGLADSARAAADGLLDARHWLFAVDGAGWVRAAGDVTDSAGWAMVRDALRASAAAPLTAAPVAAGAPPPAPPARLVDFRATDQQGQPVTAADFAGHRLVVDFIFTRCTGACPMLTARLAALRRMVAAADVRFVSFSVDPAHDTPDVLRAYAGRWGPPDPRWRLLAADGATVRRVARELGELALSGDAGSGGPIVHSDRFTLVDAGGAVLEHVSSREPAALRALAARLGAPAPAASRAGEAGSGARLFSSLGCRGCHDRAALAPPLAGVAGRSVRLADGRVVAADDGYLRQSITAPLAAVVDGFPPTMPSYAGLVSDADVASLVAYLRSLPN